MTRRDFELIASAVKNARLYGNHSTERGDAVTTVALNLADALETNNTRFDRARFLTACGVGGKLK